MDSVAAAKKAYDGFKKMAAVTMLISDEPHTKAKYNAETDTYEAAATVTINTYGMIKKKTYVSVDGGESLILKSAQTLKVSAYGLPLLAGKKLSVTIGGNTMAATILDVLMPAGVPVIYTLEIK
jgi:sRNA-binding protein